MLSENEVQSTPCFEIPEPSDTSSCGCTDFLHNPFCKKCDRYFFSPNENEPIQLPFWMIILMILLLPVFKVVVLILFCLPFLMMKTGPWSRPISSIINIHEPTRWPIVNDGIQTILSFPISLTLCFTGGYIFAIYTYRKMKNDSN